MRTKEKKVNKAGRLTEFLMAADNWDERRASILNELRQKGGIPDLLLDLIDRFKERTLVKLFAVGRSYRIEIAEPQLPTGVVRGNSEELDPIKVQEQELRAAQADSSHLSSSAIRPKPPVEIDLVLAMVLAAMAPVKAHEQEGRLPAAEALLKLFNQNPSDLRPEQRAEIGPVLMACLELADRMKAQASDESLTASDALAHILCRNLADLTNAKRQGLPGTRAGGGLPRSAIAETAMDLLRSAELWGYPPGPELVELFERLLEIPPTRQGHPRALAAMQQAARQVAHDPNLGPTQLARLVGVDKGSVSRWLKQPAFKARVAQAGQFFTSQMARGVKDKP